MLRDYLRLRERSGGKKQELKKRASAELYEVPISPVRVMTTYCGHKAGTYAQAIKTSTRTVGRGISRPALDQLLDCVWTSDW